jgi:hypothetical protein
VHQGRVLLLCGVTLHCWSTHGPQVRVLGQVVLCLQVGDC